MPHPLVDQLHFTRSEWLRALNDVTHEDAVRRFEPMNSISWMVGHLAWHEQLNWLKYASNRTIAPELDELVATGLPASTPPLEDMWGAWRTVTEASEPYLETLTSQKLLERFGKDHRGRRPFETIGTMLRRLTYHYWFHTGEALAVRQMLGHRDLPEFVGKIGSQAPYRLEEEGGGG